MRQILEQQGFYSLVKPIGDVKVVVDTRCADGCVAFSAEGPGVVEVRDVNLVGKRARGTHLLLSVVGGAGLWRRCKRLAWAGTTFPVD